MTLESMEGRPPVASSAKLMKLDEAGSSPLLTPAEALGAGPIALSKMALWFKPSVSMPLSRAGAELLIPSPFRTKTENYVSTLMTLVWIEKN